MRNILFCGLHSGHGLSNHASRLFGGSGTRSRTTRNGRGTSAPGGTVEGKLARGPRKSSDAGELSNGAQRPLRGVEAETKVFLQVIFVFVGGFMMVWV